MPKRLLRFTEADHALAKRLFAAAARRGELKPRVTGVLATGNGVRRTYFSPPSYRQYLREARRRRRRLVGLR